MISSFYLKNAIRVGHAWPGGYDIGFFTADGALLCAKCARENYKQIAYSRLHGLNDGWLVIGAEAMDTDISSPCDHCLEELAAYYEPEYLDVPVDEP